MDPRKDQPCHVACTTTQSGRKAEDIRGARPCPVPILPDRIREDGRRTIPHVQTLGPCNRPQTRICTEGFQSLSVIPERRASSERVHRRKPTQRLHSRFEITNGLPSLLCRQERRFSPPLSRLSLPERMDGKEQVPNTPRLGTRRQIAWGQGVLQARSPIGIQQRTHQGRRSMESSIQDPPRPLRTNSHVFWIVQLTGNVPGHDEWNIQGHDRRRLDGNLHG